MHIFSWNEARHNTEPSSAQKVFDQHYRAYKLPDQKNTAMQTHSVAQPVTWVRRWGDHNTQQILHAQLQTPPPSLPVEALKNHRRGEESGRLPTTELQLLRPWLTGRPNSSSEKNLYQGSFSKSMSS